VMGFFEIESGKLFAWVWLQTVIILMSAFWVARITEVSHQYPALPIISMLLIPQDLMCQVQTPRSSLITQPCFDLQTVCLPTFCSVQVSSWSDTSSSSLTLPNLPLLIFLSAPYEGFGE
jgi:hypothetical protein